MATKKTNSSSKSAAKKPAARKPATRAAAAKSTPAKSGLAKTAAAKKTTAAKSGSSKSAAAKKSTSTRKTQPAKRGAAKKPTTAKSGAAKKSTSTRNTQPAKSGPAKSGAAKKPAAAGSGPTKGGAQPATRSTRTRKAPPFAIGDKVVHPQHGAAVIVKKVKQTVTGQRQDYFQLEIATDQLTVFVPISNIEETIRPVISKNQARKVFALFKETPQEAGSNWSRWYKVLNEKMTSGDIYQVAEVVRDLSYAQQTKGISPALKRMLSKARLTLTSELRFALNIEEDEATKKLDRALPKVELPNEE